MKGKYTALHRRVVALLQNSLGTNQYQQYYLEQDGQTVDVTEGGQYSCAFFVTAILRIATLPDEPPLIGSVCLDNGKLIEGLRTAGWEEIDSDSPLKPGTVVIYDWLDSLYRHSGIVCAPDKVISNSSELRRPVDHHLTFNGDRRIILAFWHPGFKISAE